MVTEREIDFYWNLLSPEERKRAFANLAFALGDEGIIRYDPKTVSLFWSGTTSDVSRAEIARAD